MVHYYKWWILDDFGGTLFGETPMPKKCTVTRHSWIRFTGYALQWSLIFTDSFWYLQLSGHIHELHPPPHVHCIHSIHPGVCTKDAAIFPVVLNPFQLDLSLSLSLFVAKTFWILIHLSFCEVAEQLPSPKICAQQRISAWGSRNGARKLTTPAGCASSYTPGLHRVGRERFPGLSRVDGRVVVEWSIWWLMVGCHGQLMVN